MPGTANLSYLYACFRKKSINFYWFVYLLTISLSSYIDVDYNYVNPFVLCCLGNLNAGLTIIIRV